MAEGEGNIDYGKIFNAIAKVYSSKDNVNKALSSGQVLAAISAELGSEAAATYSPYIGTITSTYNAIKSGKIEDFGKAGIQGLQSFSQVSNSLAKDAVDAAAKEAMSQAAAEGASQAAVEAAGRKAGEEAAKQAGSSSAEMAGQLASWAAYAYAAYQAGKTLANDSAPKDERAKEVAKQAGLMVANYFTFGLASVADAIAMQTKEGRKFNAFMKKYTPGMMIAGKVGQNVLHKSTEGYQKQRLKEMFDSGNQSAAGFLHTQRQIADQNNDIWQEGKYQGQKWSWDKALDLAKSDPGHFMNVYANFQVAGDGWLTLPEDKKRQFVQAAIQQGLYSSDKGDILFSGKRGDLDKAKQLYQEVLNGKFQPATTGVSNQKETRAMQIQNTYGTVTPEQAKKLQEQFFPNRVPSNYPQLASKAPGFDFDPGFAGGQIATGYDMPQNKAPLVTYPIFSSAPKNFQPYPQMNASPGLSNGVSLGTATGGEANLMVSPTNVWGALAQQGQAAAQQFQPVQRPTPATMGQMAQNFNMSGYSPFAAKPTMEQKNQQLWSEYNNASADPIADKILTSKAGSMTEAQNPMVGRYASGNPEAKAALLKMFGNRQ